MLQDLRSRVAWLPVVIMVISVVISGFLWLPKAVDGQQWLSWLSMVIISFRWLLYRRCAWSPVVFYVCRSHTDVHACTGVVDGSIWAQK